MRYGRLCLKVIEIKMMGFREYILEIREKWVPMVAVLVFIVEILTN